MTTPGGVPNLPAGALTLDTLASKTQDFSGTAIKGRAVGRISDIFDGSTGLSPASDITPLGLLTRIFSEVLSLIANADPADVQGPEDIPPLVLEWIEGLPFVGEFVDLFDAILGNYTGTDQTLLGIQALFSPINSLVKLISGGVPLSFVTSDVPNLVTDANFPDAGSIQSNPLWVFDSTVSADADGSGSAKATADGTRKVIRSLPIPVTPGDQVPITGKWKWSGLTYTGNPLKVGVREFYADNTYLDIELAHVTSPGASGGFTQIGDTYTAGAGATSFYIRGILEAVATTGNVWFDSASATKPNAPDWFQPILNLFNLPDIFALMSGDTDDIWSSLPIIGQIASIFDGAGSLTDAISFITGLLSALGGPTGLGTGSPTLPDINDRIPIVGGLLDGLFGAWTSIFDIPANQQRVVDGAVGVQASITGAQAGLAQLQAALSPGNPDQDDFERSNSGNWGSMWLVMEDGNGGDASVDGHNGVWAADYTVDSECVFSKIVNWDSTKSNQASTDNQSCSVILNSAIGYLTDGNAALDLWLRMSNFTTYATRTGVRMRFWGNKDWQLHSFNAGAGTLLASGTHNQSVSSGTFSFEAGQLLTSRRFVAKINSSPIMDFTESGSTSQVGSGFRYRGVGVRGEFSLIGLAGFPPAIEIQGPSLKQWTATG